MGEGDLVDAGAAYDRRGWPDACAGYRAAARQARLSARDLDRWATAAHLRGRDAEAARAREEAHRGWLASGDPAAAVRSLFWLGLTSVLAGDTARGGAALARAGELAGGLDPADPAVALLRVPEAVAAIGRGEPAAALATCREVAVRADRTGDADLYALSRLGCGQARVALGEVADGMADLDEAMAAVLAPEVTPIAAGITYCAVILACRQVFDTRRAEEWTRALDRWCDSQTGLRPYRGQCLVHRSQVRQFHGDWTRAVSDARLACEHLARPPGDAAQGMAWYQRAELSRHRGEFVAAEEALTEASRWGHPVQPGLALLRLAQGRHGDAAAALRWLIDQPEPAIERVAVLGACVEIAVAVADLAVAGAAAEELRRIADRTGSPYLGAVVRYGDGLRALATGDAAGAGATLAEAKARWQQLGAVYEVARTSVELGRARAALGDRDTAAVEWAAARTTFTELGARPDLDRLALLVGDDPAPDGVPLTPRERQVIRLVATGGTNREVAAVPGISEHTVRRHVQNILAKLGLPSRSAATAYAWQHHLL